MSLLTGAPVVFGSRDGTPDTTRTYPSDPAQVEAYQAALAAAGTPQMLEDESMVKIAQIEGQMRASSLRRIGELVEKHPDETLAIVRGWMVQENS